MRRSNVTGPGVWAAMLMLVSVLPAAAQTVTGSVMEAESGRALPGVFVTLEDEAGGRAAAVLTNESGHFRLRPGQPGRYRVVAELIGYGTAVGEWLRVDTATSAHVVLELSVEALALDAIEVETGARCRRRPGSGPATARVWEEARKALEVAQWGQAADMLRFFIMEHRRTLDARSLRVTAQEQKVRSRHHTASPYVSIPLDDLHDGGYVQLAEDGEYDYYAPDAEVLLSDVFLDTHCFSVVPGPRDEPELIGLAFEPVAGRGLPDIEGVVWLERSSSQLRRVDFTYTDLPFEAGRWEQVGGRVEFDRLPTGMWIVRRWHIRMPLHATRRGGYGGGGASLELVTLSETGAEVRRVYDRRGALVSAAEDHVLRGTVLWGPGEGLPGATVKVLGTTRSTTTGRDGTFVVEELPPGRYTVRVSHPDLDRIGIGAQEREVALDGPVRVMVGANVSAAKARELCEAAGWQGAPESDPVLLYGTVRAPGSGEPVAGAMVRLRTGAGEQRTLADSTGEFRLCVEASPRPVEVAAVEPRDIALPFPALDAATPDIREPGFVTVYVTLSTGDRGVRARPNAPPSWPSGVLGRVRLADGGAPVEGATISLLDSLGSVVGTSATNTSGNFHVDHPGEGAAFTLRVEHIAYKTVERRVDFEPGDQVRLEVELSPDVIALEPIVVTQRRRGFLAEHGFYRRLERGLGTFVEREEIERRAPSRITDLLRGRPGVQVVTTGFGADIRLNTQTSLRTGRMACQPSVWVDGSMVRAGGPVAVPRVILSDVIDPEQVEALEVYTRASAIPIQYGGQASPCGAVVIWSRRGS